MSYKITYYVDTYGMRTYWVHTAAEVTKDKVWLEAGGYMYTIKEVSK